MKTIIINQYNDISGPFTSVIQEDYGYLADGAQFITANLGPLTTQEVPDDYVNPEVEAYEIEAYNIQQSELRAKAYPIDSDPIFFQWQRGTRTQQEWLDAVAAVQALYPYKEQV